MSRVTARELMDAALENADMDYSPQVGDKQVLRFINEELFELYDILIERFEDYFYEVRRLNIVTTSNIYTLPDDFYKLKALFVIDGTDRYEVHKFSLRDLDVYNNDVGDNRYLLYRLLGNDIIFSQYPATSGVIELWYIPKPRKLRGENDEINISVPVGWEEFITTGVVIKCLTKIEVDRSIIDVHIARKSKIEGMIRSSSNNRDLNGYESVRDVYRRFSG